MNPFEILQITETDNQEAIREAYFKLIKKHPPDRDPEGFQKVRKAYEMVKDPEALLKYKLLWDRPMPEVSEFGKFLAPDRIPAGEKCWLKLIKAGKEKRP